MSGEMSAPAPTGFSWSNFKCYGAFNGLLEQLLCRGNSWLMRTQEPIDRKRALDEIRELFVDSLGGGGQSFDEKAGKQLRDASRNAKLFFVHVEYLWAMPSRAISSEKKRSYALRFFRDEEVRNDSDAYFDAPHIIARPGSYYQTNKYFEILAILRILSISVISPASNTVSGIKSQIEGEAYQGLHGNTSSKNGFPVERYCGAHAAILHLCAPDKYQAIISKSHREKILGVFAHVTADRDEITCPEQRLNLIRERLYSTCGPSEDPVFKYRWFFYVPEIKAIWINKSGRREREFASIQNEIQEEESAFPLEDDEGQRIEVTGYRLHRSSLLAEQVKKRDHYTCKACGFFFHNHIVHVHHLDPLSERKCSAATTAADLVTLCPNCHYLAHYYLRQNNGHKFKQLSHLLDKLKEIAINRIAGHH